MAIAWAITGGGCLPHSYDAGDQTFAAVPIGAAASNRLIVVGCNNPNVTGITVGGVPATRRQQGNGGDNAVSAWVAAVPTGTTADIVIATDPNWGSDAGIIVGRLTGANPTPTATYHSGPTWAPEPHTIVGTVPDPGIALVFLGASWGDGTGPTWVNATGDGFYASNEWNTDTIAAAHTTTAGSQTVEMYGFTYGGDELCMLCFAEGSEPSVVEGSAAGESTAAATIAGAGAIAGTSDGVATAAATIVGGVGACSGQADGSSSGLMALAGAGAIAGSSDGTSTAGATVGGAGAPAGSADGSSIAAGTLAGAAAVSGESAGVASADGTIAGAGGVLGASSGAGEASLAAAGAGAIAGEADGSSTATADILEGDAVAGVAAGTSTAQAEVVGTGVVLATSDGSSTVSGALDAVGAIAGRAEGTSTATLTLICDQAVSGAAAGVATASATVAGVGAIAGVAVGSSSALGAVVSAIVRSPRRARVPYAPASSHVPYTPTRAVVR